LGSIIAVNAEAGNRKGGEGRVLEQSESLVLAGFQERGKVQYVNRLSKVGPFRFTNYRPFSFHFVHFLNAKDLRQNGYVCEMK
jgi:hypothetical protein